MPPNTQTDNRRIAKNTLFLYLRMMLIMIVTLYTSRIILSALGVVDFGIYNAVGGVVAMLGFLSSSMANAVQRFLSFEMGKGEQNRINEVFNASLRVHIIIAIIVFFVLEILGLWFLNNKLTIPHNRIYAAQWVFHCSVFSALFSIIQVPYNALIIAREKMDVYAYISIVEVFLRLGIVYLLLLTNSDKLINFAILTSVVSIFVVCCYVVYCQRKYNESRICRLNNKESIKELLGFAGWNMLGEIAWLFTGQGVNIILNIYFGPVVNAARGVAYQVDGAVQKFVQNFQTAMNPQIIKTYAANVHKETMNLVYKGTRFSYYLLLIITLPLFFEMNYVLNLWLTDVPELTVDFCRIILATSLIQCLSNLFATVAKAYGNIRNYQIIISTILFLNFPVSLLLLHWGFGALSTAFTAFVIQIVALLFRMLLLKSMIKYSIMDYTYKVLIPLLLLSLLSCIIPYLIIFYCSETLLRFILNSILTLFTTSIIISLIGLSPSERELILKMVRNRFLKSKNGK